MRHSPNHINIQEIIKNRKLCHACYFDTRKLRDVDQVFYLKNSIVWMLVSAKFNFFFLKKKGSNP